jgi:hypothetical protein
MVSEDIRTAFEPFGIKAFDQHPLSSKKLIKEGALPDRKRAAPAVTLSGLAHFDRVDSDAAADSADRLSGILDGIDGRTHHIAFSDPEMTGDAKPGAIVETRAYDDAAGRKRLSLATRSDLAIQAQISASGATWIDRQLLAKESALSGGGFGAEVRGAMERPIDHLVEQNLARRQGQRVIFARDLLSTLRRRELDAAAANLSAETGLSYRQSAEGDHVSGVYRRRVTLSSGRFAMIDDVMGFQLVPWRPALEQRLGQQVSGTSTAGGGIDWSFQRKRGLCL